jgi:hypothetical protein
MKPQKVQKLSRVLLVTIAAMLASCAMPPKEAWRYIRQDGLIPYLAIEMGRRPVPGTESSNRYIAPAPALTEAPPACATKPAALHHDDGKTTPARKVTPAPMPRLHLNNVPVDTEKPAPKPKAEAPEVKREPQKVTPPPSAPAKPKAETPKPKVNESAPAKSETPRPKATEPAKPKVSEAPKAPAPKTEAPKTEAPKSTSPTSKPADTTAKADELPYGTPVPGRPGLVNSPYAGKMQLVDITGLKPGQEVKCPYTGKLFRVPPGAQAKVEEKK